MNDAPLCLPALAIGVVLMAGCAGIEGAPLQSEGAPLQRVQAAAPAEAIVAIEPRAVPATPPAAPKVAASPPPQAPRVKTQTPAAPVKAQTPAPSVKTPAPAPVKTETPAPPTVKPAGPSPLDLDSLEARLRETKAIGVFTKLALKNQIDDLLERFRAFYQGRIKTSLAELRRAFDMLVMKALALLQDADPPLAGALASSRESIWGILSDPKKFPTA